MHTVVDFHSHILPEIDDGSSTVEESILMLQQEVSHGVECVVATPHFYANRDSLTSFLEKRKQSEQLLREEMEKHSGLPELIIGAEVYYFKGISASEDMQCLTISSTRCIMIEMPPLPWTDTMYRELEQLYTSQGLVPIVAHIDRYITPFCRLAINKRLATLPVLVQANADFFLRRQTKALAQRMLRDGKIHVLGSDCHNLNSRKPNLGEVIELINNRIGASAIAYINQCEQEILHSDDPILLHT